MTTHPLAQQAAKEINSEWDSAAYVGHQVPDSLTASIIHTTAVQPILDKGDALEKFLQHRTLCGVLTSCRGECTCGLDSTLKSWRDLKAGCGEPAKTSTMPSGLPSDEPEAPKLVNVAEKEWRKMAERLAAELKWSNERNGPQNGCIQTDQILTDYSARLALDENTC